MTNTEIQVNEYVRTIDGYIRKVTQVNEKGSYDCLCWGAYFVDKDYKHCKGISAKKIKSHSFNLIDLIEAGDYVNGLPVRFVENGRIDIGQEENYLWLKNEHIVSVVTHEQFSSMEYRVGGE